MKSRAARLLEEMEQPVDGNDVGDTNATPPTDLLNPKTVAEGLRKLNEQMGRFLDEEDTDSWTAPADKQDDYKNMQASMSEMADELDNYCDDCDSEDSEDDMEDEDIGESKKKPKKNPKKKSKREGKSYTLSDDEAEDYDSGDARRSDAMKKELMKKHKGQEIYHPDGYVIYSAEDMA